MNRPQQTIASVLFLAVLILGGWSWSQDSSPSDLDSPAAEPASGTEGTSTAAADGPIEIAQNSMAATDDSPAAGDDVAAVAEAAPRQGMITNLTIFVLAVFLGIEVISKVPPTLHTPLMSGSNAISGIALVGAVIVASAVVDELSPLVGGFARFLGFIAVTLAMINAVGGFMVTHRMLSMFNRK